MRIKWNWQLGFILVGSLFFLDSYLRYRAAEIELRGNESLYSPVQSRSVESLVWLLGGSPPNKFVMPDLTKILTIKSEEDIKKKREHLLNFLFGSSKLIQENMSVSSVRVQRPFFLDAQWDGLYSYCEKTTFRMEFGIESNVYHLINSDSKNLAVFYFEKLPMPQTAGEIVKEILRKGFSVALFFMPLKEPNSQPVVHLRKFGFLTLREWNWLALLKPVNGAPEKYFITPLLSFVRKSLKNDSYENISLVGFEKAAWPTLITSALVPQINTTMCVAGPYPFFLMTFKHESLEWLEFPFGSPKLFKVVGHIDLLLMAASGKNRKLFLSFNRQDLPFITDAMGANLEEQINRQLAHMGDGSFENEIENVGAISSQVARMFENQNQNE